MVVHHPHLDTLVSLADEDVAYLAPDAVVLVDVILQVDVVGSCLQVALEGVKLVAPAGKDLYVVAGKVLCTGEVVDQPDLLARLVAQGQLLGVHAKMGMPRSGGGCELLAVLARDESQSLDATAEEDVQHQAHDGQKDENRNPCQRLDGITVLTDDDYNGRHDAHYIEPVEHIEGKVGIGCE